MPTADRPVRAQRAIQAFLRQDYPERELVILDDGEPAITVPDDPRIRYYRDPVRKLLGWKREKLIELAHGDVMVLWDDDDWHGPQRVSVQVDAIRDGKEASIFSRIRSYDETTKTMWESPGLRWLFPCAFALTRKFHSRGKPYPNINIGSDRTFIRSRPKEMIAWIDGREHYVMVRHSSHRTSHAYTGWQQLPSEGVLELDV